MLERSPITQRDVARACGLHASTVCLALKNSPSIPEETRRRIHTIAEELGYQPNVAARNLALLRAGRSTGGQLPIAWINQEPRRDYWRTEPEAREYFESAQRRAAEAGYHLEEIWTCEPGMNAARIVQIVRARGIAGAIFPTHRSFDFSLLNAGWNDCALVGCNDLRLGEWIDVVCADFYKNTDLALRQLRRAGCERVGLVLSAHFDSATQGLVHGCFLRHQSDVAPPDRIPVCFLPPHNPAAAWTSWLHEHRPDAVIHRDRELLDWPAGEFDFVRVQPHGNAAGFDAAIDSGAAEVAAAAVDCVIEKMRRFEKGIRESTRLHLIKGTWQAKPLLVRSPVESVVA